MWYTDEEILYDVAHALNPYQQIRVLAELNDVSVSRIEKVLRKHNVPLPEYQRQSRMKEYKESREVTAEQAKRREKKRQWYKENRAKILARKAAYRRRRRERENGEE